MTPSSFFNQALSSMEFFFLFSSFQLTNNKLLQINNKSKSVLRIKLPNKLKLQIKFDLESINDSGFKVLSPFLNFSSN